MERLIREELLKLKDEEYAKFNEKLCPDTKLSIIGVRVPILRTLAKDLVKQRDFSENILEVINYKNSFFEEVLIKGFILGYMKKPFEEKIEAIKCLIPQMDSWAITDTIVPTFKLKKNELDIAWKFIIPLMKHEKEFTVRFALIMMLDYFVNDEYIDKVIKEIDKVKNNGYYTKMAVAWLIAEIGIKYNEKAITYLTGENNLDKFTHNKAIQKMIESYRVSEEKKNFLRSIKIK